MRNRGRNCVTPIPIIHPVGISDRVSFVLCRGGGFVVWGRFRCLVAVSLFGVGFLVFVFVVAVVSLFVVGFFVFFNLSIGIVVGAPTPNGVLK